MKRILKFVGLKIVEISALVFIPYGIGRLVHCFKGYIWQICNSPITNDTCTFPHYWRVGAGHIFLLMGGIWGVVILGWGIVSLIKLNWEWAGK